MSPIATGHPGIMDLLPEPDHESEILEIGGDQGFTVQMHCWISGCERVRCTARTIPFLGSSFCRTYHLHFRYIFIVLGTI